MNGTIRDLGFLAWKNDLSDLESQKGSKWKAIVDSENTEFKKALKPLSKKIKYFESDLHSRSDEPWIYKGWSVSSTGFSPYQIWKKGSHSYKVSDADLTSEFFAGSFPSSDGFERFTVKVFSKSNLQIASIPRCGPEVVWSNGKLFYLGSSKDLRYDSLQIWNPSTKESICIYELDTPEQNLRLQRSEDGSAYVIKSDFVSFWIGFIQGTDLRWVRSDLEPVYVNSLDFFTEQLTLPGISSDPIEAVSLKAGWIVTRSYGIRQLWNARTNTQMIVVWGEIQFDLRDPYTLMIYDMRYEPYRVNVKTWKLTSPRPFPYICMYYNDVAPSFVIRPSSDAIKGLLITAYGAYGTATKVGTLERRWRPLLNNGWAIASVCVPGSGDHDTEWKLSGQRRNRQHSIDVFYRTIQSLQNELSVSPSKTVLYGRSAGGLLVISTAIQHKGLVGGLYVESPYVDVLRTISNPDLPLTNLETKEFGIGSNVSDVVATGQWSPMEHIPTKGIPELFVVARTDMNDLEVFPYEVVKWILRMRSDTEDFKKLLYVEDGKGHFTTTLESRAEDLALLDAWIENSPDRDSRRIPAVRVKNHTTKYKMPPARKNKSRKNRANKSRKNNAMMGGRRRRSTRRHRGRKH